MLEEGLQRGLKAHDRILDKCTWYPITLQLTLSPFPLDLVQTYFLPLPMSIPGRGRPLRSLDLVRTFVLASHRLVLYVA
jgi:hypothetical protein